jgi:hypothetical protein
MEASLASQSHVSKGLMVGLVAIFLLARSETLYKILAVTPGL